MATKPTPKKTAVKTARKAPVKPAAVAPKKAAKSKPDAKAIPTGQNRRNPVGPQPAGELAASAAARMLRAAQKAGATKVKGRPTSTAVTPRDAKVSPVTPVVVTGESPGGPGVVPGLSRGTSGGVDAAGYAEVMAGIIKDFDLSEREARFVMELAVDGNASAAYIRAGYSAKNANDCASRLSAKASIQAASARVRAIVAERTGYSAQEALQFVADVLRADTRELVEYKVSCCRFCYGDRNRYQRTEGEMDMAREAHDARVARRQERNKEYEDPGFDEQGGDGFDLRRPPNTECPVCAGDGSGRVVIKDTRTVSKAAANLYAGVKEGKDGVEIKFHDKAAMVDKMFRYHGLYEADNKQSAAQAADPAALIALSEAMDRSREQRRAIMERRRQMGFTGD